MLSFLGGLPATPSVYSLTLTRNLSPLVVGPLVPATMLLCVALELLPLWPLAQLYRAADWLRLAVAVGGLVGLRLAAAGSRREDKTD